MYLLNYVKFPEGAILMKKITFGPFPVLLSLVNRVLGSYIIHNILCRQGIAANKCFMLASGQPVIAAQIEARSNQNGIHV